MWRQNRRQVTPTCVGVDINRNFGYSWRAATILQPVKILKKYSFELKVTKFRSVARKHILDSRQSVSPKLLQFTILFRDMPAISSCI